MFASILGNFFICVLYIMMCCHVVALSRDVCPCVRRDMMALGSSEHWTVALSRDCVCMCRDMMALGSSEHWTVALQAISGTSEMSALPLVEYFRPLLDWLEAENEGEAIGWEDACPPELTP